MGTFTRDLLIWWAFFPFLSPTHHYDSQIRWTYVIRSICYRAESGKQKRIDIISAVYLNIVTFRRQKLMTEWQRKIQWEIRMARESSINSRSINTMLCSRIECHPLGQWAKRRTSQSTIYICLKEFFFLSIQQTLAIREYIPLGSNWKLRRKYTLLH